MKSDTLHKFGFEGELVGIEAVWARGTITMPENTWEAAEISIELSPNALEHEMPVPFTISGRDRFGRVVTLHDVAFSSLRKNGARRRGMVEVEIKHVGRLEVWSKSAVSESRSI